MYKHVASITNMFVYVQTTKVCTYTNIDLPMLLPKVYISTNFSAAYKTGVGPSYLIVIAG